MAFATIDVTKGITGTIPVANGGTGLASGTAGQFLKFTGTTTVASSAVDAGKVAQVIEGDVTTHTTITSTSWVDVNLEVTITPSATSSKVLIIGAVNNMKVNSSSGGNGRIRLQWDQVGGSYTTIQGYEGILGYNDNDVNNPTFTYLHSPSSTAATKYKIQAAELSGFSSGSMRFNNASSDGNSIRSSIVAMEILS